MLHNTNKPIGASSPWQANMAVMVTVFALYQPWQAADVAAAEPRVRALAHELVLQLGHEEFSIRERAAAELIELEADAAAALRVGAESPNREIRLRSVKLLALVSELDLQRRFERFKNETDPNQDYGLPGWDSYREVVGDSMAARSIFVSMHEDESRLLGRIGASPRQLADALSNRCDQLRDQAEIEGVQVRLGTIATLLFVATRDDVEVSPLVQSVVYKACSGSSFEAAIESERLREVLVTLAERWITRQPSQGIAEALQLGLRNDLKRCLQRARDVFESPVTSVSDRICASLCVAKFGDESDFARLETYLADVTILAQDKDRLEGQVVVTEMRDIALAGLVRLAKLKPTDFGFDRIEYHSKVVFNISSLGFRDEQSRSRAISAWHEYRRSRDDAKAPE